MNAWAKWGMQKDCFIVTCFMIFFRSLVRQTILLDHAVHLDCYLGCCIQYNIPCNTTSDVYFSVFSIAGTSCRWGDQAHHGKNPSWKPDQKSQMAFRNPISKQAPGYHEWSLSCNENPQFCKPWQLPKKKLAFFLNQTFFLKFNFFSSS